LIGVSETHSDIFRSLEVLASVYGGYGLVVWDQTCVVCMVLTLHYTRCYYIGVEHSQSLSLILTRMAVTP